MAKRPPKAEAMTYYRQLRPIVTPRHAISAEMTPDATRAKKPGLAWDQEHASSHDTKRAMGHVRASPVDAVLESVFPDQKYLFRYRSLAQARSTPVRLTPLSSRRARFLTNYCPVNQVPLQEPCDVTDIRLLLNPDIAGLSDQEQLLRVLDMSVDELFTLDQACGAATKSVVPYVSTCFSRLVATAAGTPGWSVSGLLTPADERAYLQLLQTHTMTPSTVYDAIWSLVVFRTTCASVWRHDRPDPTSQSKAAVEMAIALFEAAHEAVTPHETRQAQGTLTSIQQRLHTPRCLKAWPTAAPAKHFQKELDRRRKLQSQLDRAVWHAQEWARDQCSVQALMVAAAQRIPLAVRRFQTIFMRLRFRLLYDRFHRWEVQVRWAQVQDRVHRFFTTKGTHRVALLLRTHVRSRVRYYLAQWRDRSAHEQSLEVLAAQVTLHAWMRSLYVRYTLTRRRRYEAVLHIQRAWRSHCARRFAVRKARYCKYLAAARKVQRFIRARLFRTRNARYQKRNKSARLITRCIRTAGARRMAGDHRMEKRRCERAAVRLQCWYRQRLAKAALESRRHYVHNYAARTLQKHFKWTSFICVVTRRAQRRRERLHAAALVVQQAFRAKRARARLWTLRDEIEALCRRTALREMWERASATAIQEWWRRRKRLWARAAAVRLQTWWRRHLLQRIARSG